MTTFNTNTDLNARSRRTKPARNRTDAQISMLSVRMRSVVARMRPNPAREMDKAARRADARRTVDNLLR